MTTILAATGNTHKLEEIRAILEPHGIHVLGASDVGGIPEVEEDGDTFAANARKKALEVAAATGQWTLADDSGLVVEALNGEPGVFSARYSGAEANDRRNLEKLLRKMGDIRNRSASFQCVVAVAGPGRLVGVAEGDVKGTIIFEPRGSGGFGYDPVFVPDGFSQTFAELPGQVKNTLSHRGRALQAAVDAGLFEHVPSES
jgi:XTP/dITP diphosphohydrolase